MKLTNEQITLMLNLHHIEHYTNAGRVIAIGSYTWYGADAWNGKSYNHHEDLTGYTKAQLYHWLGY